MCVKVVVNKKKILGNKTQSEFQVVVWLIRLLFELFFLKYNF